MDASQDATPVLPYASSTDRVVFRRDAGQKVLGAVMYILLAPFLGLLLGLFASVAVFALLVGALKLSNHTAVLGAAIAACLCILGLLFWAIRDYRTRAFQEYVFTPSNIEFAFGRKRVIWSHEEIAGIRLESGGRKLVLDLASGRHIYVDTELAGAPVVLPTLENGLLHHIAKRHQAQIESGELLTMKDLGFRAIPLAFSSLLGVAGGVLVACTMRHALEGARLISNSITNFRQCVVGFGGGLQLSREGIAATGNDRVVQWDQITQVKLTPIGLFIMSLNARPIKASPYAMHFCDICKLLQERGLPGIGAAPLWN